MGITFDEQLRALGNEQRRWLLARLHAQDPGSSVHIWPAETDGGTDGERTLLRLRHVHLPLLSDLSLIEWGGAGSAVTRGDEFAAIVPLLDLLVEHDENWPAAFTADTQLAD